MKKKRSQNQNQRIVQTVEIDYDKLAKAIVAAQKQTMEDEPKIAEEKKFKWSSFFKSLWNIIRNKNETEDRLTTGALSLLLYVLFSALFLVGLIVSVVVAYVAIISIPNVKWDAPNIFNNITYIGLFLLVATIIFLYSFLLKGAANEILKTEDKHFVVGVFSGIVGLAALVASLIALTS